MMKGFMRIICVILCLIISSTTAYGLHANTVLWSKAYSSTNLIKDEGWIEEQISAEALFVTTMEPEMPVTTVEGIEDITGLAPDDDPDDEGIEIIDSMIVEEGSEWSEESEEPTADTPEAPEPPEAPAVEDAVEDMVTTQDGISAQEEGLNELVEDHIETGDTIPE